MSESTDLPLEQKESGGRKQLQSLSSVPSSSYSGRSWLGTVFNRIGTYKNKDLYRPNVIHLLGGSFVLDFHSNTQDLKNVLNEPTTVVGWEKENYEDASISRGNPTDYSDDCDARVPNKNPEEQKFLKNMGDQEGMPYMVIGATLFSIVSYIGHVISDVTTAWILFQRDQYLWAALSLAFTFLPIIVINAASFIWYYQNNFYRDSLSVAGWRWRVFAHIMMMGMVCRNVDILLHGFRTNEELKKPPSFLRGHYFLLYREQRRVTAFLTLIQCFLQDAPQFSLQVYIWTVQNRTSTRLLFKNFHLMQYASIAVSLVSLCYSVVSYHQTLRYTRRHVLPMSFLACIAQFTWRLGTTGSRLLVIMFAVTAYPTSTLVVIGFHWGLMTLWLLIQQNTNVLVTKFTSQWAEILYNILMGVVHIFCFLNVFVNQTRYRLILFYVVQFMEDFAFLCLWYVQLLTEPVHYQPWIYHLGAAIYINAFIVGIAAMVAFYLILHPNMTELQSQILPDDKRTIPFFKLLATKLTLTRKQESVCVERNPRNSECCSENEPSSDDVDIDAFMSIK